MAPVDPIIINAIENLNKSTFSGAMPFVFFTAHGSAGKPANIDTIGTKESYEYGKIIGNDRFVPLITNLEVKPTGTMGVVREGSVTIKFASMQQMKRYQDFFRIGTAKTITWGWNKNRLNGSDFNVRLDNAEIATTSKEIVNDIDKWRATLKKWNYTVDILVGPLIDFSFTLNNDASVDVVFTVGSPNELVAFMGSHKKDSNAVKSSDSLNIAAYRVASLLNLVQLDFTGGKFAADIRPELLNYDYTQSTIQKLFTAFLSFGDSAYDNVSEDIYISFGAVTQYAINQNPPNTVVKYIFDIDEAISVAHPNIISNSENVIFLNKAMANPFQAGDEIKLDIQNTQNFDTLLNQKSHSYPESGTFNGKYGGATNTFSPGQWGYVKNVFFKLSFVQDIIKNNGDGNIVDIVEKLCNEINVASCGLTDLSPQVSSKQNGKEVFTIVDYALNPTITSIPTLNLFEVELFGKSNSSTITNISFNCDLPKEIGAMAMLGNRKGIDVGQKTFFGQVDDTILAVPAKLPEYSFTGGQGPQGPQGPTVVVDPKSPAPGTIDSKGQRVDAIPTKPLKPNEWWEWIAYGPPNGRWEATFNQNLTPGAQRAKVIALKKTIDESCVFIKYDDKEHSVQPNKSANDLFKAVFKNTDMLKSLYFGNGNINKNNPLLPIELEITVLGISGIIAGQVLKLPDGNLPFGNAGIFQVKEVNHTVNDKWETTIKLGFRPE